MYKNIMPLLADELKLPCYVTAVGSEKNQAHVVRPDGYPNYHWLYCTNGKGMLVSAGNEYILNENMGVFLFSNTPHEYYAIEEPWETYWVVFDGFEIPDLLNILGFVDAIPYYINVINLVDRLFKEIHVSAQLRELTRGYKCSYLLYSLLIELKNGTSGYNEFSKNTIFDSIQQVVTFIEENYNHDITLNELSGIINASPQYLCRIFTKVLRMRPFEYITKFRMQKAKEFIAIDNALSINYIAEKVGFHDTSYFCAKFSKYEGMTPTEFRNMYNSKNRAK